MDSTFSWLILTVAVRVTAVTLRGLRGKGFASTIVVAATLSGAALLKSTLGTPGE
jgi:hypothetical protein